MLLLSAGETRKSSGGSIADAVYALGFKSVKPLLTTTHSRPRLPNNGPASIRVRNARSPAGEGVTLCACRLPTNNAGNASRPARLDRKANPRDRRKQHHQNQQGR